MAKKMYFLTLDTETATLPFANEIAKDAKAKQKIAIAKPLVYDIGWVITDRKGNIYKRVNYLVQETFFVPNVFNTAYYCNKRPIYMDLLAKGQITAKNWNDIMIELLEDCGKVNLVTAYNACFDYKKAIPFTERYIKHLYNADYNEWEKRQKKKCVSIVKGKNESENPDYLIPTFTLRDQVFPMVDLWGLACEKLINIDKYRDYCLSHKLLTASATFFKTSAETTFQYLMHKYDFIEDHTALSDATIEAEILTKALKKSKVEPNISEFPFRKIGTTTDYVKTKRPKYKEVVIDALAEYIENNNGEALAEDGTKGQRNYWNRVLKTYGELIGD